MKVYDDYFCTKNWISIMIVSSMVLLYQNCGECKKNYHYLKSSVVHMNEKLLERRMEIDNITNKRLTTEFISSYGNSICGSARTTAMGGFSQHTFEWIQHWYTLPVYKDIVSYLPDSSFYITKRNPTRRKTFSRRIKLRNRIKHINGYLQTMASNEHYNQFITKYFNQTIQSNTNSSIFEKIVNSNLQSSYN